MCCRKLAQQWHPDNFTDENDKKKAEKKFMDIAAAKEVLSDPGKYLSLNFGLNTEKLLVKIFAIIFSLKILHL